MRIFHVSEHNIPLVVGALNEALRKARADLALLRINQRRDLKPEEHLELPSTLMGMDRTELFDYTNAWITLVEAYESLIEEFSE